MPMVSWRRAGSILRWMGGLDAFDIYAPAAVITGAGGHVSDWNGDALGFDMAGNVLAAGDRARMDETLALLNG